MIEANSPHQPNSAPITPAYPFRFDIRSRLEQWGEALKDHGQELVVAGSIAVGTLGLYAANPPEVQAQPGGGGSIEPQHIIYAPAVFNGESPPPIATIPTATFTPTSTGTPTERPTPTPTTPGPGAETPTPTPFPSNTLPPPTLTRTATERPTPTPTPTVEATRPAEPEVVVEPQRLRSAMDSHSLHYTLGGSSNMQCLGLSTEPDGSEWIVVADPQRPLLEFLADPDRVVGIDYASLPDYPGGRLWRQIYTAVSPETPHWVQGTTDGNETTRQILGANVETNPNGQALRILISLTVDSSGGLILRGVSEDVSFDAVRVEIDTNGNMSLVVRDKRDTPQRGFATRVEGGRMENLFLERTADGREVKLSILNPNGTKILLVNSSDFAQLQTAPLSSLSIYSLAAGGGRTTITEFDAELEPDGQPPLPDWTNMNEFALGQSRVQMGLSALDPRIHPEQLLAMLFYGGRYVDFSTSAISESDQANTALYYFDPFNPRGDEQSRQEYDALLRGLGLEPIIVLPFFQDGGQQGANNPLKTAGQAEAALQQALDARLAPHQGEDLFVAIPALNESGKVNEQGRNYFAAAYPTYQALFLRIARAVAESGNIAAIREPGIAIYHDDIYLAELKKRATEIGLPPSDLAVMLPLDPRFGASWVRNAGSNYVKELQRYYEEIILTGIYGLDQPPSETPGGFPAGVAKLAADTGSPLLFVTDAVNPQTQRNRYLVNSSGPTGGLTVNEGIKDAVLARLQSVPSSTPTPR